MARKKQSPYQAIEPEPGFEEHWQRHLDAMDRFHKAEREYDKVFEKVEREGGTSSSKSWGKFEEAEKVYLRAMQAAFGTLDHYVHAVAHKDDAVYVDEKEVSAVVKDSLSDKLDELEFTLNIGLLGAKVAQAIRKDVTEGMDSEPLFCQDCEED